MPANPNLLEEIEARERNAAASNSRQQNYQRQQAQTVNRLQQCVF